MPKIHTQGNGLIGYCTNGSSEEVDETNIEYHAILAEEQLQINKSKLRKEKYINIIQNIPDQEQWLKPLAQVLIGVLGCVIFTSFYTLIPVHDLLKYPYFWYELPLQVLIALWPNWAAMVIFRCSYYMNVAFIRTITNVLVMWLAGGCVLLLLYSTEYLLWTHLTSYQYPVPLNGYITAIVGMLSFYSILWTRFPTKWRKNSQFKLRLMSFVIAMTLNQAVVIEYALITKVLLTIPTQWQWIAALMLPLVREFNTWISLYWARKASGGDLTSALIACHHAVSITHSLFLTYTLGSVATILTSGIVLGSDFMINVFTCLWIIRKKKKDPENIDQQIELAQLLVVYEMVEFVVPLSYLLCFLIAYFGPNADLIGDVGSSYWQYNAVKDVWHVIKLVSIFFCIDVGSIIINTSMLWYFSQINLWRIFLALQHEFGVNFLIVLVTNLNAVRKTLRAENIWI